MKVKGRKGYKAVLITFLFLFLFIMGGFIFSLKLSNSEKLKETNMGQNIEQSVEKSQKKDEKIEEDKGKKEVASSSARMVTHQSSGRSVVVPILTYHYVGNNPNPLDKSRDNLSITPEKFEGQMEYLSKNGYKTITLDTLYAGLMGNIKLDERSVVLTFDDGYVDFYFNAYPILKKYNLSSVVFIPTGLVGGGYYMNWSQIKELYGSGIISFQSHSVSHPVLTGLSQQQLEYEIKESKKVLEQQLGYPVNFFAYPYGISNVNSWQEVKKAGYVGAVGTWNGRIISEGTIYDLPRIKVSGEMSLEEFGKIL